MRLVRYNSLDGIPIVATKVFGRRGPRKLRLAFDTGSGLTQIDTSVVEALGYSAKDALRIVRIRGATGEIQEGYLFKLDSLTLWSCQFVNIPIVAMDLESLRQDHLDGLLGFDIIKTLRFLSDGPGQTLAVMSN